MNRKEETKVFRVFAIVCAVAVLGFVVLNATISLMAGTKVRRLFGMSEQALAGRGVAPTMGEGAFSAQAGDGGTDAGSPGR